MKTLYYRYSNNKIINVNKYLFAVFIIPSCIGFILGSIS
jgi:hypothetical protein